MIIRVGEIEILTTKSQYVVNDRRKTAPIGR
jgi:hypothetical protein